MKEQNTKLNKFSLVRFKEHSFYNQSLHAVTLFPYVNIMQQGKLNNVTLNLSFKEIDFDKKKVLPFFLALELMTGQKCVATLSSKNLISWKLRKGMLVGCKVTLRKNVMEDFFETLLLVLPRMNLFKGIFEKDLIKNKKVNSFSIMLKELFFFFTFESILGTTSNVQQITINLMFSTKIIEEKLFMFYSKKIPVIK